LPRIFLSGVFLVLGWVSGGAAELAAPTASGCFAIRVVDDQTGRGVPLVELKTSHFATWITDSAGWVAFNEPGLMGRPVFFEVKSHGYHMNKDGFGYAGARLTPRAGAEATIKIKRDMVAERLYRITGEGIYRDSVLLGRPTPLREPVANAGITGQDSALAALYKGKYYWFFGDTSLAKYPLGVFRSTGATSEPLGQGGLAPEAGLNLRYFTDAEGVARAVCPLEKNEGVIWLDGLVVVPDGPRPELMAAHYTRLKKLGEPVEHGLVSWQDNQEIFTRVRTIEMSDKWRHPSGHPLRHQDASGDYLYFGVNFPTVRVRADWQSVQDPAAYEGLVRATDPAAGMVWQRGQAPLTPAEERRMIKDGRLDARQAWYQPVDAQTGKPVEIHFGSVRWNAFRKCWVLVANQQGGTSYLGEVWYAEAPALTGPWRKAVKILTHEKYSFYSPLHMEFFDQEGGRFLYFQGTYSHTFAGSGSTPTPRYDYNQMMYRLDLQDARLRALTP
jgi:hypothetical protein